MNVFVDEAIYQPGDGVYVVAAVLLDDTKKASARRAASRIPPIRGRRFHWHNEDPRERFAMLAVVVQHAVGCLAYVATPARGRAQEAIRQGFLHRLVQDLARHQTIDLVVESRQHHNDQRDSSTLIRARQELSVDLGYTHLTPADDPLLWMADAIAGAVLGQARKDGRYVTALPSGLLTVSNSV